MHVSVYCCGCKPVHTGLPLTDPITIKEQVLLVSKTCVVSSKLPNDSVWISTLCVVVRKTANDESSQIWKLSAALLPLMERVITHETQMKWTSSCPPHAEHRVTWKTWECSGSDSSSESTCFSFALVSNRYEVNLSLVLQHTSGKSKIFSNMLNVYLSSDSFTAARENWRFTNNNKLFDKRR